MRVSLRCACLYPSRVQLFGPSWTVALQAPLSMKLWVMLKSERRMCRTVSPVLLWEMKENVLLYHGSLCVKVFYGLVKPHWKDVLNHFGQ